MDLSGNEKALLDRIEELEKELKEREQDKINSYTLMSEVVRLRRLSEIISEERDEFKLRAEKAERGYRNLCRWAKINAEEGGNVFSG